jgi:dihydroorotate dehydrogenase electron transfer subunit
MTTIEQPKIYRIEKIIDEAKNFKTFIFKGNLGASPGQFVMFWIPGVEMKPFSISYQDEKSFQITAMLIGDFTKAMFKLKKGDKVGIQGPYGRGFWFKENLNKIAIIGGGCGIAPVNFLVYEAKKLNKQISFIGGCRSKDVFIKDGEIKKLVPKSYFATDDGSFGEKGFTTEILEDLIKKIKIEQIFACGPEVMLYKIANIGVKNKIPTQVSIERMMKCAIGICGQCCLDESGQRVCKEGPVFEASEILNHKEFGKYKRDEMGKVIEL